MSPRREKAEEQQQGWREEAVSGASLRQVDLERGANGWASPPGDLFHLRARGYFSGGGGGGGGGGGRRGKAPSAAEWLLRPAGVDWLRSHSRLDHVLARDDIPVAAAFRRARLRKDPSAHFLLAVNLQVRFPPDRSHLRVDADRIVCDNQSLGSVRVQVPGRPDAYSAVFYFAAEAAIPAVVSRMMRCGGMGGAEAAVSVLWAVCHRYRDRRAVEAAAASKGGLTKLLLLMQSGCSPAARQMASELLKMFKVNAKSCLAGYDSKTTHIMPF
jgi:hypothetical protein